MAENAAPELQDRVRGLLLGTAVGDALGLPAEGLSPGRRRRLFGTAWRHRLLPGRGLLSDDTEQSFLVGQCLLAEPASSERFVARFAWRLRGWIAALPPGVGFATLKAGGRLWLGFPPSRSGVFSAGNGPAMRAAPIGARHCRDADRLHDFVQAASRLTHTDPRATTGALAVATVVGWVLREQLTQRPERDAFLELLHACEEGGGEWSGLVNQIGDALARDVPVEEFAASLGHARGVTGYVYATVPVVLHAWYRHFGDFERTLTAVLDCGGDTDTTGAIAGALAGAVTGEAGIPQPWIRGIVDWPLTVARLREQADRLTKAAEADAAGPPVPWFWPAMLPRNLLVLALVLAHGLRRLLPPYGTGGRARTRTRSEEDGDTEG